ncbi:hypothetical protein HDV00_006369 [Rhizophlyctis rosea]|nr:hypothetical protein HDV00_006369 [Rhizophlyctis rosea]
MPDRTKIAQKEQKKEIKRENEKQKQKEKEEAKMKDKEKEKEKEKKKETKGGEQQAGADEGVHTANKDDKAPEQKQKPKKSFFGRTKVEEPKPKEAGSKPGGNAKGNALVKETPSEGTNHEETPLKVVADKDAGAKADKAKESGSKLRTAANAGKDEITSQPLGRQSKVEMETKTRADEEGHSGDSVKQKGKQAKLGTNSGVRAVYEGRPVDGGDGDETMDQPSGSKPEAEEIRKIADSPPRVGRPKGKERPPVSEAIPNHKEGAEEGKGRRPWFGSLKDDDTAGKQKSDAQAELLNHDDKIATPSRHTEHSKSKPPAVHKLNASPPTTHHTTTNNHRRTSYPNIDLVPMSPNISPEHVPGTSPAHPKPHPSHRTPSPPHNRNRNDTTQERLGLKKVYFDPRTKEFFMSSHDLQTILSQSFGEPTHHHTHESSKSRSHSIGHPNPPTEHQSDITHGHQNHVDKTHPPKSRRHGRTTTEPVPIPNDKLTRSTSTAAPPSLRRLRSLDLSKSEVDLGAEFIHPATVKKVDKSSKAAAPGVGVGKDRSGSREEGDQLDEDDEYDDGIMDSAEWDFEDVVPERGRNKKREGGGKGAKEDEREGKPKTAKHHVEKYFVEVVEPLADGGEGGSNEQSHVTGFEPEETEERTAVPGPQIAENRQPVQNRGHTKDAMKTPTQGYLDQHLEARRKQPEAPGGIRIGPLRPPQEPPKPVATRKAVPAPHAAEAVPEEEAEAPEEYAGEHFAEYSEAPEHPVAAGKQSTQPAALRRSIAPAAHNTQAGTNSQHKSLGQSSPGETAPVKRNPSRTTEAAAKSTPAKGAPTKSAATKLAPPKGAPSRSGPSKEAPSKPAPSKSAPSEPAPSKQSAEPNTKPVRFLPPKPPIPTQKSTKSISHAIPTAAAKGVAKFKAAPAGGGLAPPTRAKLAGRGKEDDDPERDLGRLKSRMREKVAPPSRGGRGGTMKEGGSGRGVAAEVARGGAVRGGGAARGGAVRGGGATRARGAQAGAGGGRREIQSVKAGVSRGGGRGSMTVPDRGRGRGVRGR